MAELNEVVRGKFTKEGWGWPTLANRAHYFKDDVLSSLCGRWMYNGKLEQGKDNSPDNCKECIRKLAKLKEEKHGRTE